MDLKTKIKKLPKKPGIYFFKNNQGKVIYIGKSVNLKNRVRSYFQTRNLGLWTRKMVGEIADIVWRELGSEFEALLWEAKLINKFQPQYNIQFKDDKRFLMIAISQEIYPRIFTARKKDDPGVIYFGPFPSAGDVRQILKTIRRVFGFRSCKKLPKKACLYYHLHLCPGCCLGFPKAEYKKIIKKVIKFLNGNIKGLLKELAGEMRLASKNEEFEKAADLKRQIEAINFIVLNWQNLQTQSLSLDLLRDEQGRILAQAQRIVPQLKALKRIEGLDISNLSGQQATGSLVVFQDLKPANDQYRRFKIRQPKIPDDVGMIEEVLQRRIKHREWLLPDLIVIDGGKAQVGAAVSVLRAKNLLVKIAVLGLTKSEETIIKPIMKGKLTVGWQEIKLTKDNPFLRLLEELRNEAHRFAKKYHLLLRKKKMVQ